ncbi:hypothetical protein [Streptomyces sp. NRRL F-5755]|uniref:hypothetical protein n=1 Tax=Streptomyces sp. NRRL F-5755 TaxID=1519475 RepID=UPI001331719E|nr:hypothetical protein [Streptomyces sp. NRRL F-5755]
MTASTAPLVVGVAGAPDRRTVPTAAKVVLAVGNALTTVAGAFGLLSSPESGISRCGEVKCRSAVANSHRTASPLPTAMTIRQARIIRSRIVSCQSLSVMKKRSAPTCGSTWPGCPAATTRPDTDNAFYACIDMNVRS